jgi:hypothetical protein
VQTSDQGSGCNRTAIIVSGMHRSGTSAITRVVSLLGPALPNQLIEGDHRNERGFWEGRAVVDMNKRVLARFGSWGNGWESIDPEQLLGLTRVVERTRRLIRDEFAGADLIVLKDPRICRLLPLWTRALEKEGFRCVHVLALRHPGAVADSLARRDGLSPKATMLAWLAHALDAEFYTRGQPRAVVSFENLLRDWRSEADRVGRALDVEWPKSPDDVADAVSEFIEPGLVHEPPASDLQGPVAAISPVYDALRRWSEGDDRPDGGSILDSWRELLEPIRSVPGGAARMSIERKELIADLKARKRPVGPLGSGKVWGPIQYQGYNLEADAAWAWLRRERQHDRAARRAEQEITRLERSLSEAERSRGLLPRVTRRLGRRRLVPAQAARQHTSGDKEERRGR